MTAVTSGGFSLGNAVLRFLLAAAGGLLAGVAVALAMRLLRSLVRDPLLVNCISLATPFAAYRGQRRGNGAGLAGARSRTGGAPGRHRRTARGTAPLARRRHLPDASLRILERELDHEERIFPGPGGH